jgi:glutathione synthase/RimK-type ligase-like ATP-grasp enzyme
MILICGPMRDYEVCYIVSQLLERNAPFLLLDPRLHGDGYGLSWSVDGSATDGRIWYRGRSVRLADIRSAFVRETFTPPEEGGESAAVAGWQAQDTFWLLSTFLETAPILVVNRDSASATNYSKPYQQQRIAASGFRVPRTLVTSCPEEARRFYEQCERRVIFKSISAQRSIVVRMTDADLDRLEQVRNCPTQFQEWVPGTDIRVHAVGSRLFATEIRTDAVDYRYAGMYGHARSMRGVDLPAAIARRCREVATGLGLFTAGIDLRRTPEGEYYCFEANPSPGFTFYQQYTGQRIGEALADALIRGAA